MTVIDRVTAIYRAVMYRFDCDSKKKKRKENKLSTDKSARCLPFEVDG